MARCRLPSFLKPADMLNKQDHSKAWRLDPVIMGLAIGGYTAQGASLLFDTLSLLVNKLDAPC